MPPYLAGRSSETQEFEKLLGQDIILENPLLTGLRGVGKTVLLETFKPLAINAGWLWVGTDLSESTSIREERLAIRMLADLAIATSSIVLRTEDIPPFGFSRDQDVRDVTLSYDTLMDIYEQTPGLIDDKLKNVLQTVWACLKREDTRGLIFAYDEAQNLSDHAKKEQFPLSIMLDVFQSIQKQNIPFMLALSGLPTLMPKLVESRTFAERMFHVIFLDRLSDDDSRNAIVQPIQETNCPIKLNDYSVDLIVNVSAGYPYFIQFICREVYDAFLQNVTDVPIEEITRKLDNDFFAGRWARATDRQRELLAVISELDHCDSEFTVQEVQEKSKETASKPFSASHTNQMLSALGNAGLVYKNRHGKYSLAVPLMGRFIRRQMLEAQKRSQLNLF